MSRSMRAGERAARRFTPQAAAALLAVLLCAPSIGRAEDAVPGEPVAASVRVALDHTSLTVSDPLRRARVTGSVSASAAAVGGVRVVLEARSGSFHRTRSWRAKTDGKGRFAFSFRPQVNAALRVRIAEGQPLAGVSASIDQYVSPKLTFAVKPARALGPRPVASFTLRADGPALLSFDGHVSFKPKPGTARMAYFYVAPKNGHTFARVASARLRSRGCGTFCEIGASIRVHVTKRLAGDRSFVVCARGTLFRGLGVRDSTCGRGTLKR